MPEGASLRHFLVEPTEPQHHNEKEHVKYEDWRTYN